MNRTDLNKLLSEITSKRYVNLFAKDDEENKDSLIQTIIPVIRESQLNNLCIDVDIRNFFECENESEEAKNLLRIINNNSSALQNEIFITNAISVTDALDRLNHALKKPGLLTFHCFRDNRSEKEKDILRAIRKFINMIMLEDNIPRFLGILIVSSSRIDTWELFPESNLDKRHVGFIAY